MENQDLSSVLPTQDPQLDPLPQALPPSYLPPPDDSVSQFYWSQKQETRVLEYAFRTRLARSKRKLARQRTILAKLSSSSSSSSSSGGGVTVEIKNKPDDGSKCWFDFYTPNSKRLRVLLKKDLKNSDVGSLGRIVLPKCSCNKENYSLFCCIFHKFAGEFVKQNGMESGDSLFLYEDENNNLYYTIQKASKSGEAEPLEIATDNSYENYFDSYSARDDDDDVSLAVLIEDLNHKEQKEEEEVRSLMEVVYASNAQESEFNYNNYTPQNAYQRQI
ncbi:unnamed protein product [Linum tenue]|uniref:TF-B3 domain-containing protein n=1 Tax=Linum tenue TaxID=586396 RepID=A0AAV0PCF4_9ROSI|nr:unnamed protein product [Linum tenue]